MSAQDILMGNVQLTELNDDLPEVIRVSSPDEKPNVTDLPLILRFAPKDVLLHVGDALHEEADCKEDHACNISSSTELGLMIHCDIRRVEQRYRQRNSPDP